MSMKTLSITLLLLSVSLCAHSFPGNKRHPSRSRVILCCQEVSSTDITNEITMKTYERQYATNKCVDAIIFHIRGGKACVDPTAQWVEKFINKKTPIKL